MADTFWMYADNELRTVLDKRRSSSVRIAALTLLQRGMNEYLTDLVMDFRERGATWEEIGRAAGITKQAAQKRWG